jgi:hypothetical protein
MKFIVALLLTALLSFITSLWFAWWSIAIVAFIVAILVPQRPWKSFLSGFLGLFLLWGVLAKWIDANNDSILSSKISILLGIGNNPFYLILITAFVGGLVAGFAALTASFTNRTTTS